MLSAGAVGGPSVLGIGKLYDNVAGHSRAPARRLGRAIARPDAKQPTELGPGQYRTERIFPDSTEDFSVSLHSSFVIGNDPRMNKDRILKGNVLAKQCRLGPGQYEIINPEANKNRQPAFSQSRGTEAPEALRDRKSKEHILGPAHYSGASSDFDINKTICRNGWAGTKHLAKATSTPELKKRRPKCQWNSEWSRVFGKTVRVPQDFQRTM